MRNATKPNIVVFYADDLGYGDLSCYGAEEISTPNIDRLLAHGIRFDNAYSTSAVCTPARYSVMTGEYPFRNPLTKILPGNATCIIDKNKQTLPKVLKQAGYATGMVGKWHLGLGSGDLDWNGEIDHAPIDIGFESSFFFPATNDRVPCVFVEGRRVVNLDSTDPLEVDYGKECPYDDIETAERNPDKLRVVHSHGHNQSIVNGVGRMGYMRGGKAAVWKDEELAETFVQKAQTFIEDSKEKPFFLFYALHQPHVPRLPSKRFAGATKLGARGDVIVELDWCVGEVVDCLNKNNLLDDTIIIFSSDNGPVLDDGYKDGAAELTGAHLPAGPLRGGKYSKFDGGTRVPFIVSWKNHMKPGTSDALVSQVDLTASFASMLDVQLEENAAPDSLNMIDALLGESFAGRKELLAEGNNKGLVLRSGKWSYIRPSDGVPMLKEKKIELGNSQTPQLFNMSYDIGQRINVAENYPEVVKELDDRIAAISQSKQTRNA